MIVSFTLNNLVFIFIFGLRRANAYILDISSEYVNRSKGTSKTPGSLQSILTRLSIGLSIGYDVFTKRTDLM